MNKKSTRHYLYSHKYLSVATSALLLFSLGSLAGCAGSVPNDGNTDQGFNENYDQYREPYPEEDNQNWRDEIPPEEAPEFIPDDPPDINYP